MWGKSLVRWKLPAELQNYFLDKEWEIPYNLFSFHVQVWCINGPYSKKYLINIICTRYKIDINVSVFSMNCVLLVTYTFTILLSFLGNPGLAGFYRTFIEALYFNLNQQYPVWVVSHGGHCKIPHEIKRKEGSFNIFLLLDYLSLMNA